MAESAYHLQFKKLSSLEHGCLQIIAMCESRISMATLIMLIHLLLVLRKNDASSRAALKAMSAAAARDWPESMHGMLDIIMIVIGYADFPSSKTKAKLLAASQRAFEAASFARVGSQAHRLPRGLRLRHKICRPDNLRAFRNEASWGSRIRKNSDANQYVKREVGKFISAAYANQYPAKA